MEILRRGIGKLFRREESKKETTMPPLSPEDRQAVSGLISKVARESLNKGTTESIAFALFLMENNAEIFKPKTKK